MSLSPLRLTRRSIFAAPLLLVPAKASAVQAVPPFPQWVGRTALLRSDGGAATLLFSENGTGLLMVRLLLFCRALPIRNWQFGGDGLSVRYSRVSARDSSLLISGEAHILAGGGELLWIEARRRIAVFQGFSDAWSGTGCL